MRFKSFLDGDGYAFRLTFGADGRAHYKSRFVRTEEYVAETAADKILYRSTFGTQVWMPVSVSDGRHNFFLHSSMILQLNDCLPRNTETFMLSTIRITTVARHDTVSMTNDAIMFVERIV